MRSTGLTARPGGHSAWGSIRNLARIIRAASDRWISTWITVVS